VSTSSTLRALLSRVEEEYGRALAAGLAALRAENEELRSRLRQAQAGPYVAPPCATDKVSVRPNDRQPASMATGSLAADPVSDKRDDSMVMVADCDLSTQRHSVISHRYSFSDTDVEKAFRDFDKGKNGTLCAEDIRDVMLEKGAKDPDLLGKIIIAVARLHAAMPDLMEHQNQRELCFLGFKHIMLSPDPAECIPQETRCRSCDNEFMDDSKHCHHCGEVRDEIQTTLRNIRDAFIRHVTKVRVSEVTKVHTSDLLMEMEEDSTFTRVLETAVAGVILLNAVAIGMSEDLMHDSWLWKVAEIGFTIFFAAELVIVVSKRGAVAHFFGVDWQWNWFDFSVVLMAVVDLAFTLAAVIADLGDDVHLSRFTIVRLARLARITRIVRLLRMKMFKELTLMINGVIGGLRTLFWAFVLLLVLVYVLAVLLRQTTREHTNCNVEGPECTKFESHIAKYHEQLFGGVLRCMFTVFRCFTDGCSSPDGTPLTLHLMGTHGWIFVLTYTLFVLFIIFGIFNLIAAVFVENTLEYARFDAERRHQLRHKEHIKTAQELQAVALKISCGSNTDPTGHQESDLPIPRVKSFLKGMTGKDLRKQAPSTQHNNWRVTHDVFNRVMLDPQVQVMMDDLEISVSSRSKLFDVLDSDSSGTLDVAELVEGLMKLRGPADKGDVVSTRLMIRNMQSSFKTFERDCIANQRSIEDSQAQVKAAVKQLREELRALQLPSPPPPPSASLPTTYSEVCTM